MPLRNGAEYKDSLRDGRTVYVSGEKVQDVTSHRILSITIEHSATVFDLAFNPETKDLFTSSSPRDGKPVSRYFKQLKSPQDLLDRNRLIEETTKRCRSTLNIMKAIGSDALNALTLVSHEIKNEQMGEKYGQRIAAYLEHCRGNDLAMAVAQTDVKGDRSLRPHEQRDPDMYVHVVEKRSDGIVVRGAKAHTTGAPGANEIVSLPTRAMTEQDKDYAVAFAVPGNAKGLTMICRPTGSVDESVVEHPVSRRNIETETITVFDDVFVPWSRVFLCGEWKHAGRLATIFANYHRFTAISYKPPLGDVFIGAAQLIAEYNGVGDATHIREKIAKLIQYTETTRACAKAAALECLQHDSGLVIPNPAMTNIGKYHFASQYQEAVSLLQDIAGGLVITAPSEKDLGNPETSEYLRKYLAASEKGSAEERLKLFYLIRDLTASDFGGYNSVVSLHGEGSLEAQLITTYREYDVQSKIALVKEILG